MSAAQKAQCFHSFAANRQLCLPANTHLVFLGESTMRFQYLLLAWALLHQVEYRDRDMDPSDPRRLHSIASFSKGGVNESKEWSAFLNYSNAVLHPYEHCDCMRHNSRPRESATIAHRSHIENRYFHFGSVRLTYLTCMGRNAHHGVWWPGDADSLRTVHPAGTPWRWELPNASSVVTRLLPILRPTHVVYFVGGVHLRMQQAHAHKHRYAAGRGPLGPLTDEELRAFNASFRAAGLEGVSLACISRMGLNDGSVSWAVQKDENVRKHCGQTLDLYPIMRNWGRDAFHDYIHYNDYANGILLANLLTSLFPQRPGRAP